MSRKAFILISFAAIAAACADPAPPPHRADAPPSAIVACYDADRDIVSHLVSSACAGEVIDAPRELQLAADRTRRIQAAIAGRQADPITGNLRLAGTGSGFFVSPTGDLLTNNHVIAGCEAVTATPEGAAKLLARVVAADATRDIALLRTSASPRDHARFTAAPLDVDGSTLAVAGYPAYGLPTIHPTIALVSAPPRALGAASTEVVFTGAIRRGHSGSPLLDGAGNVLGVVRAKPDIPRIYQATGRMIGDYGIAISSQATLAFLGENGIRPTFAPPSSPALARDVLAERMRSFVAQIGCWRK
jgi:S1-C subfamily serine protease